VLIRQQGIDVYGNFRLLKAMTLSQPDAYGHDGRHDGWQEAAGEVRRADPVRPRVRTRGSRRGNRVLWRRRSPFGEAVLSPIVLRACW